MDSASCEICPSLHEEINSLNKKLERVSKGTMTFSMNSKDERTPFKRPYTKYSYVRKNKFHSKNYVPTIRCHYCGISGHTTPHCHIRRVEVPKGVMKWVPKVTCCETHPKAPTCVDGLVGSLFLPSALLQGRGEISPHHQHVFDIIKKGENEDNIDNIAYGLSLCFGNIPCVTPFESSKTLSRCVLFCKLHFCELISFIFVFELTHYSLNRFNKVSDFM
ncbi:hypothetical protein MtrunA17_Chr7g0231161 [Medicago truncatula]|nr:hypothetical protein MtrunA17_Chr7g0231161 [Medicago truncatula]